MRPVLAGAVLLLLVAGCGGTADNPKTEAKSASTPSASADPDAAWKAAVAEVRGEPMTDEKWASYSDSVRSAVCESDDFVTTVAVAIDIPGSYPALNRIAVKYGCPDHLAEWDAATVTLKGYLERGRALCGPTKELAERLAVAAKLSAPGPLTDAEILSAVC